MRAIEKRCLMIYLHFFQITGGPMVDLSPLMSPDAVAVFVSLGFRAIEGQCWPLYTIPGMPTHPNAHEPWAFPRDDDGDDGDEAAVVPPPRGDDDDGEQQQQGQE